MSFILCENVREQVVQETGDVAHDLSTYKAKPVFPKVIPEDWRNESRSTTTAYQE
jgi:anaerobic ribonucleoside-triphosphate reductase